MTAKHGRYQELISAYVLHSLDAEGMQEAEAELLAHVAGCSECAQLFQDMREMVGDLALAPDPMPLPSGMEDRLMAAVRADSTDVRANSTRPASDTVVMLRRPRWWQQAAVAAVILAIGFAGGVALEGGQDETSKLAVSVMSDPTAESATLTGRAGTGLVYVGRDGRGVVIARSMKNPPRGRVLKLWLMADGTPVPASAFRPRDEIVPIQVAPGNYEAVAVTIERDPHVKAPTGRPISVGTLAS